MSDIIFFLSFFFTWIFENFLAQHNVKKIIIFTGKNLIFFLNLQAYIYGALHNYEPLKLEAFNMLDQNWKMYENSADLLEMMKTHPQVVMEILNRLHKKKSGFLVRASQVNLKMIKAFECMQESIIKAFTDEGKNNMPFTDMTLVSATGQEVQCHR